MQLTRRVRLAGVDYLLCDARTPAPEGARRLRPHELERLLAQWRSVATLRSFLVEFSDRVPPRTSLSMHERARLRGGHELVGYELPSVIPHTSPPRSYEPPEIPTPEPFEPSPLFDEPHWIEVQVVGEDGEGIAGVVCEVKLPSGKIIRRRTDRLGLVRIDGIAESGTCEFSLPDLDRDAWTLA